MHRVPACRAQQGVAFRGVVSVPDAASLPADPAELAGWEVVTGTRGLAAQRNAGLDALRTLPGTQEHPVGTVAFFDDDAVPRPDYLARALGFLAAHPDVVGLTGRVLADGKITGEIPRDETDAVLARSSSEEATGRWRTTRELYGANFVVRTAAAPDLRFDARLPLYSWLEDHDFARRLMRRGPLAHVHDCVVVHRAAASGGRASHRRLGYSQVMNAVYLRRKGSFPLWLTAQQVLRPVLKNIVLAPAGPAAPWRRERLRGNTSAVRDVLRGRITPERIVEL